MPRSSSSNRSTMPSRSSAKIHTAPPYTVAPFRPTPPSLPSPVPAPTTGQIFKEGIASGVGSGIGFSLGSRLFGSLFGPSQATVMPSSLSPTGLPFVQTTSEFKDEMQQCVQHSIEKTETPLCVNLYKKADPSYTEFQQCMKSSDYQIHVCKDFLPTSTG